MISATDAIATHALLAAVRQSADIICDRWSISLIAAEFMGARRFNEFVDLIGVTGGLLTARLRRLEQDGILLQTPYSRRPPRNEYWLTNMGRAFFSVLVEMVRWEQSWSPNPDSPMLRTVHTRAPKALLDCVRCEACRNRVTARDVGLMVSRARLEAMPVKQTAFRRSSVDSDSSPPAAPLLGPSLDLLGDKWSIEVINCSFLGVRRFGDFKAQMGVAGNVLGDRLNRLVAMGFLSRHDGRRGAAKNGYWLTPRGLSFYPVLLRLQDWADTWIVDRYRSPVTLVHKTCGQPLAAHPTDVVV